ncbi:rod shape-determining protein MreD [Steroidobacter sp. S1-65]|uniref:Rod shape-determining protein MreD n=1 Tax=Steroidobacter gossypii TaxID=2805490 RepID=A0ABS1X5I8_9GAMM|nr:rod shape-determining protein MreD [Steroidobacter gossypii]MBM0108491.1 rod shape-determining protein MreD [Steroidobacter gossypii]
MSEGRISRLRITMTVIVAIIFAVVPLPEPINAARPDLLLLLVIYWSLIAPRTAGLLFAWFCGLAIDVVKGIILGQHAFAFVVVAYMTHKQQLRMRLWPVPKQALAVCFFLGIYQLAVFWLDGIIGQPVTTWQRWLPVLSGALLWPVLVAILDTWNRRNR